VANEFSIATDIKVEMLLPVAGKGIWNFSKWGGSGVDDWVSSAGSGFAWTDVVATISQATITQGSTIDQGYYAPAQPNTLELQMQSATYDPSNNNYIRPGLQIKVSYRPNPDTAPSTYVVLFQGYVDDFGITYDALGNNIIDITASSSLKRMLNKNLTSWVSPASPTNSPNDFFNEWVLDVGADPASAWSSSYQVVGSMEPETIPNVTGGEVLDWLMQAEAAIVWQVPSNDRIMGYSAKYFRNLLLTTPTNQLGGTHAISSTHFCIADLELAYNTDEAFNTFICTCDSNAARTGSKKNQDLVDLYGELRLDKTLKIAQSTATVDNVQMWLDFMAARNPGRRVNSVQTPAIRRDGTLANLPALQPALAVRTIAARGAYTVDENSIITKATHTIDPDNWFVTLDLWKGL
jgi:hypothetical protein